MCGEYCFWCSMPIRLYSVSCFVFRRSTKRQQQRRHMALPFFAKQIKINEATRTHTQTQRYFVFAWCFYFWVEVKCLKIICWLCLLFFSTSRLGVLFGWCSFERFFSFWIVFCFNLQVICLGFCCALASSPFATTALCCGVIPPLEEENLFTTRLCVECGRLWRLPSF